MFWFNLIALFGLLVGFAGGVANIKSMRTAPKETDALLAWKQDPIPWHYEGFSNLIILIHSASVSLLGILLLVSFNLAGSVPAIPFLGFDASNFALMLLGGMAVIQAGFGLGSSITYHIAVNLVRPVPLAITETGLRYGKMKLDWSRHSHYEIETGTGFILLYSSYSPDIVTGVLMPPPESAVAVAEHVRRHLPSQPPVGIPWTHSKTALFAAMTALAVVFLVPGVLLVNVPVAWVYYPVAIWLLQMTGIRLIKQYDSGGATIKDEMAG